MHLNSSIEAVAITRLDVIGKLKCPHLPLLSCRWGNVVVDVVVVVVVVVGVVVVVVVVVVVGVAEGTGSMDALIPA